MRKQSMISSDDLSTGSCEKRLNEMSCLSDMAQFPISIYAGASFNVLLTILATWWIHRHYWELKYLLAWLMLTLSANILPIVVLRLVTLPRTNYYPTVMEMRFCHDQHKLSDWVYIVASANILFWIVISWILFTYRNTYGSLIMLLNISFLCTFSPALVRLIRRMAKSLITWRPPHGRMLSLGKCRHHTNM
jgi:hypothetical protein